MQRMIPAAPKAQTPKSDVRQGPVSIDPRLFQHVAGGVSAAGASYDVSPTGLPKGGWGTAATLGAPKGGWL